MPELLAGWSDQHIDVLLPSVYHVSGRQPPKTGKKTEPAVYNSQNNLDMHLVQSFQDRKENWDSMVSEEDTKKIIRSYRKHLDACSFHRSAPLVSLVLFAERGGFCM